MSHDEFSYGDRRPKMVQRTSATAQTLAKRHGVPAEWCQRALDHFDADPTKVVDLIEYIKHHPVAAELDSIERIQQRDGIGRSQAHDVFRTAPNFEDAVLDSLDESVARRAFEVGRRLAHIEYAPPPENAFDWEAVRAAIQKADDEFGVDP